MIDKKRTLILLTLFIWTGCISPSNDSNGDKRDNIKVNVQSISGKVKDPKILEIMNQTRAFYEMYLQNTQFNGGMIVAKNGLIVFEKYDGLHSFESKKTNDQNSPFHLASISKTFTGMAICKLWEEGKLQLDDEVKKYLTNFNFPGITIRNLASHRSGLPNYVYVLPETYRGKKIPISNTDILEFLNKNKATLTIGTPNKNFVYCNTNYALLALVIEKVTNLSYPEYLKKTFFEPLGMNNTFVCTSKMDQDENPSYNVNGFREAFTYLDLVYGDKNIYSTPRDLLKWDIALSNGSLFKPETLAAAYSGYSFEKKGVKNYGIGWRLYLYPNNRKIIYHNGWWHGNNTVFARLVNDSATIIILGNKFNKNIYESQKMYSIFGLYDTATEEE